ncbi:MAG: AMP-dependent synthetase/ligase [Chthonomonadales bacterium]
MEHPTIYEMFRRSAERFPDRRALGYKHRGRYEFLTYRGLMERVLTCRRGLAALGIRRGDRVAILSENRAEWAITDLACQAIGAVTVPIYYTLPREQVQYIVTDSAARALVVSDAKQMAKALGLPAEVRTLEHVIALEAEPQASAISFAEMLRRGTSGPTDAELDEAARNISPDDIATLIYTSGTTGEPKGAMLTHRNLLHTSVAARQIVHLDETDIFLSFLPLCHIFERTAGHYLPLSIGALIIYSEGIFAVANELVDVRPTAFLCVPRLYEAMHEKILEQIAKTPPRTRRIVEWALETAQRYVHLQSTGRRPGILLKLQAALADRLALRRIRQGATGGRIRFLVAGGAPLDARTFVFFQAIGVNILEGYGLTELPVISVNRPGRQRQGTVGEILPGIEVRIAEDGEILARGPSLMRGYFGRPQDTAQAIDAEGWFRTGDIGVLSNDGYLKITDRKKDIIVLANGKNVAPQPIEASLKTSPYISEAVLFGDRSNAIVAVIVPAFDRLKEWARNQQLPASSNAELVKLPEVRKLIKGELDRLSDALADFERIKRFALVPGPFSIEGGELTPTLKVKRRAIAQKYADVLEQLMRSSA